MINKIYLLSIVYAFVIGGFFGLWLNLGIFWGIVIGVITLVLTIYSEKIRQNNNKNK
ncbi:MAG: hypothetical protein VX783_00595 [Chloroflexota bacterium]|jgi:uncharacterized membrane protein|nr:hypothetical protein [Chloroflexota bacterium]